MIEPEAFVDNRGFFFESYSERTWRGHGLDVTFVQDNHSRSVRGVLRGLHLQDASAPQYRLVRCTVGEVWDVAVDIRAHSPTFGQWFATTLSAQQRNQVLLAPHLAHGFVVLTDVAEVQYKVSGFHTPTAERSLRWNDPEVGIPWPFADPVLSSRDADAPCLSDFRERPTFASDD